MRRETASLIKNKMGGAVFASNIEETARNGKKNADCKTCKILPMACAIIKSKLKRSIKEAY